MCALSSAPSRGAGTRPAGTFLVSVLEVDACVRLGEGVPVNAVTFARTTAVAALDVLQVRHGLQMSRIDTERAGAAKSPYVVKFETGGDGANKGLEHGAMSEAFFSVESNAPIALVVASAIPDPAPRIRVNMETQKVIRNTPSA